MLGVLHYFLILCFGIHQIASFEGLEGGCIADLSLPNTPLVLRSHKIELFYPTINGTHLMFAEGFYVNFICPGTTIMLRGIDTGLTQVTVLCLPSRKQSSGNYRWSEVKCKNRTVSEIDQLMYTCAVAGRKVLVKLQMTVAVHINVFHLCFDRKYFTPIFSYHKIIPYLQKYVNQSNQPDLLIDQSAYSMFNQQYDPETLKIYDKDLQRQEINDYFGYDRNSKYLINDENYLVMAFLTRGSEFVYEALGDATFRYINTVPQWKTVQINNWAKVENEVREYARKYKKALRVWTGVKGISSLPKNDLTADDKEYQEFYLYNKDDLSLYPVPKYFWKLVYHARDEKAVVLVTFNSIFETHLNRFICEDVSYQTGWINFEQNRSGINGYSYACSYESFRRAVNYVPFIKPSGLLFATK